MKKLLIVPIICAVLAGCANVEDDKEIDTGHGNGCATKVVTIEGHKYVIMDGYRSGCIVHAASCECMNKQSYL